MEHGTKFCRVTDATTGASSVVSSAEVEAMLDDAAKAMGFEDYIDYAGARESGDAVPPLPFEVMSL